MTSERTKLVIIFSQLRMGGAERAAIKLAALLRENAYDITVITLSKTEDFYQLPDGVKRVKLDIDRRAPTILHTIFNTVLRVWRLRKSIVDEAPDVVLTMLPINDVLTAMALLGTNIPQVISTRVYPSVYSERPMLTRLKRVFYPLAKHIVSVSTGVDECYQWIDAKKRSVIGNIPSDVDDEVTDIESGFEMQADKRYVVSMGRFVPDKNFALLVEAFACIASQNPDWNLMIIGDGALKLALKTQAEQLGIGERVVLPGRAQNPFPILKRADLFVLPSDYEGVPNTVLEAMACGVPVITTDYYGEPRDIVTPEQSGVIVPRNDAQAMADAMHRVMNDELLARTLTENGLKFVKSVDAAKIVATWDAVFRSVSRSHAK